MTAGRGARYVVLRHEGIPAPHFDFMFERSPGGPLVTFRIDVWPVDREITVVPLSDHRRDYLDYEGPVSGDRGFVRHVSAGRCDVEAAEGRYAIVFHPPAGVTPLVLTLRSDSAWVARLARGAEHQ
jgi:hypothetical protein